MVIDPRTVRQKTGPAIRIIQSRIGERRYDRALPDTAFTFHIPHRLDRHRLVTPLDVLAGKALDPDMLSDALGACAEGKPSEQALLEAEQRQREREEAAAEARRRARKIRAQVAYSTRNVDPFSFLGVERDSRGGPATDKQLRFLRNMGVAVEGHVGRWEASAAIDRLQRRRTKNLCSYKQARLLARFGLPDDLTFAEAREAIDVIADPAQGGKWKAPKWLFERFVKVDDGQ